MVVNVNFDMCRYVMMRCESCGVKIPGVIVLCHAKSHVEVCTKSSVEMSIGMNSGSIAVPFVKTKEGTSANTTLRMDLSEFINAKTIEDGLCNECFAMSTNSRLNTELEMNDSMNADVLS